jgi:hypothetical protein
MDKWEYTSIRLEAERYTCIVATAELNTLGNQGWELVSIAPLVFIGTVHEKFGSSITSGDTVLTAVLKRRKP